MGHEADDDDDNDVDMDENAAGKERRHIFSLHERIMICKILKISISINFFYVCIIIFLSLFI